MNLYVHFPFCRRRCTYCALHSRAGSTEGERRDYVERLVAAVGALPCGRAGLDTVYFGGGSPALCDLGPLFDALAPLAGPAAEFTVELHPLDATRGTLASLKAGGVNRISMGVQSLDDGVLRRMGRGYSFAEAERAFGLVRENFDNAGIDLITGYPGETAALLPRYARLAGWGLSHCSVYSLILEERSALARRVASGVDSLLPDDTVMDRVKVLSRFMADIGLRRYEISNYGIPGRECRHNIAVWRGEDYFGLGEGARGRVGLMRTKDWFGESLGPGSPAVDETVTPEEDEKERRLFALRTAEGLDTAGRDGWAETLDGFAGCGLVVKDGSVYRLTERGTEVCDSILAELA